MVLDTSALLALLLDEPEAEEFRAAVEEDATRLVSAANLLEAALVIETRKGEPGGRELDALIQKAEVAVVPLTRNMCQKPEGRIGAWQGRHPAALNFGDLFAYALARTLANPSRAMISPRPMSVA